MRFTSWVVLLAGLGAWSPIWATTWNTNNSVSLTARGGSIYCSTTTCSSSAMAAPHITLTAYSTPTSSSTTSTDTGNWTTARIAIYGGSNGTGGIGISNNVQSNTTETSSPQHAIDNKGVDDILVVDFGSSGWDVSAFTLGYVCNASTGSCSGATPNVDAWVGGTSEITNWTTFGGFSGNGATTNAMSNMPGFNYLSLSPDPASGSIPITISDSSSAVGRYLVISGNLANYSSAFKVSSISASIPPPPPPPNNVPVPGSAPLVALGLLGMGWFARRRASSRRA